MVRGVKIGKNYHNLGTLYNLGCAECVALLERHEKIRNNRFNVIYRPIGNLVGNVHTLKRQGVKLENAIENSAGFLTGKLVIAAERIILVALDIAGFFSDKRDIIEPAMNIVL